MGFRAELDYNIQDIRQFETLHQKLRYKALFVLTRLLLILGCCAILVSVALALVLRAWNRETGFYLLLPVFMLALLEILTCARRNASLKSLNAQGPVSLTTEETGLVARATSLTTELGYDAFCDLVHYRDTYYLYVDKRKAQIIPERCFIQGDPDDFGRFMTEKTGLQVKEIK